jgi:hypothetical protein
VLVRERELVSDPAQHELVPALVLLELERVRRHLAGSQHGALSLGVEQQRELRVRRAVLLQCCCSRRARSALPRVPAALATPAPGLRIPVSLVRFRPQAHHPSSRIWARREETLGGPFGLRGSASRRRSRARAALAPPPCPAVGGQATAARPPDHRGWEPGVPANPDPSRAPARLEERGS